MRVRRLAVLIASAAMSLLPVVARAQQATPPAANAPPQWYGGPGYWHMMGDGYGWHWFWGGPFMMLLTIFAFVWVMRLLFGHARWRDEFHHHGRRQDANRSALRILNERFARGEIPREEYEDKKAVLLADGAP